MNVLGLITARGGSRGIPRKNVVLLRGRPLLAYTADAALGSRRIDRVVMSTDDEEIATVGRAVGIEVPFLRPDELAGDDVPSLPVVQHACAWLHDNDSWAADVVVLLQPTSPLRRPEHVDAAVDLLEREEVDTVVSVIAVPHRFNPYSVMTASDGRLRPFIDEPLEFDRYRRQALPAVVARNGPAVLATRASIVHAGSLYGERIAPLVMSDEDSVDIDTELDLAIAEMLLARRE